MLPKPFINNQVIKRQSSVKFLGILLHENLSWRECLKLTQNKVAKNIGLIYKAKLYLNKDSLALYVLTFALILTKYANLVWGRTNRTYFQKTNAKTCFKINT